MTSERIDFFRKSGFRLFATDGIRNNESYYALVECENNEIEEVKEILKRNVLICDKVGCLENAPSFLWPSFTNNMVVLKKERKKLKCKN